MLHTGIQSVAVFLDSIPPRGYDGGMDELIDEATEMIFDFMDDHSLAGADARTFLEGLMNNLLDTEG
jgi:hypothetical protein